MIDNYSRIDRICSYKLYSLKRFPKFVKYCIPVAKDLAEIIGNIRWYNILIDMIWCNWRYGAMHSRDYLLFEFWKKSSWERNSFFTQRRYYKFIKSVNKSTLYELSNKVAMYKKYSNFIKREWIIADDHTKSEDVYSFAKKHSQILVKPMSSEQGRGIRVLYSNDKTGIEDLIRETKTNAYLLEEVCTNCEEFNLINSKSLNTLRIYTIVNKNGIIEIPSISLRCGCGDNVVDNWGAGGIGYPVDIKSGIIYAPGKDKRGNKHIYHPGTNFIMPGFRIPHFKEACEMAINIIEKDKNVVYAGHDIAILKDRIELIEVNFPGGHDFLQALDQVGKNDTMNSIMKIN